VNPRLVILLVGALSAASLIGAFALEKRRADRLQGRADAFEACEAAVAGKPKARPAAEVCSREIAAADAVADRARACDAALARGDLYGVQHSCSTPVKRLDAQLTSAGVEITGLQAELKQQREGQAAALRDAERRGQIASERKARRDAAVQAAPRDGDGLRVYDAGSVCARWGCPGDARP